MRGGDQIRKSLMVWQGGYCSHEGIAENDAMSHYNGIRWGFQRHVRFSANVAGSISLPMTGLDSCSHVIMHI